jgi:hypothetical protein
MVSHPKSANVVDWSLSGVKSGQEIGKMLSIAQNGAKQASKYWLLNANMFTEKRMQALSKQTRTKE